jgi:hypothetical protein
MSERKYYSIRTGKNRKALVIELTMLKRLFKSLYKQFLEKEYFQEAFGFWCVDEGDIPGSLGSDIEAKIFILIRKDNLWPIEEKCRKYSEDDLFDVIEFLYDYVSKPIDGYFHEYNNCGWHYTSFDKDIGQSEFRVEVNALLCDYEDGYELSEQGEILVKGIQGLDKLFKANIPIDDHENIQARVNAAILKFRRFRSTLDDRRDAIRDLADVLEYLRPSMKQVLTKKDESDLFNIANNFGIRHHNKKQQTDYDKSIWYSWMFYYYLATIHAVTRFIKNTKKFNFTKTIFPGCNTGALQPFVIMLRVILHPEAWPLPW